MKPLHTSWTLVVLLAFCWVATTARAQEEGARPTPAPERTDWMGALPDDFAMCKLSLPGTHDSGARLGGPALQTQDTDIPAQLQQGIRAFDIRLQAKDGRLGVFHSTAFQQIYWETDVLPAFIRFLQEHPTEVLVVSLKREGGAPEAYAARLAASLELEANRAYFVEDFHPALTLGDCRGKILFLHRDVATDRYPGAACSGWADDATCVLTLRGKDGREGHALLQDEYQYTSDQESAEKIAACTRNLAALAAEPEASRRWGISFASATGLPDGTPKAFADQVNPALADWLARQGEGGSKRGIVFIDFIAQEGGRRLVSLLIDGNFR